MTQAQKHVDLMTGAQWLGHSAWSERRLFQILGSWAAGAADPDVAVVLAVQCRHHGWYSEIWRQRMPVVRGFVADEVTVPRSAAFAAAMTAVALEPDPVEATGTVETAGTAGASDPGESSGLDDDAMVDRLVGLYRVMVPHLLAGYESHRASLGEVADGPLLRWSGIVLDDARADLATGEALLARLVVDEDRAARRQRLVADVLARAN